MVADVRERLILVGARRDLSGGYKVDVTRGTRIGRVSSEWFSRPDDERFLTLGDLASAVRGRSERSRTRVVETALIHVEANWNDPERLALILPGADAPMTPTHWSFGQLAGQVGAPASYLRNIMELVRPIQRPSLLVRQRKFQRGEP